LANADEVIANTVEHHQEMKKIEAYFDRRNGYLRALLEKVEKMNKITFSRKKMIIDINDIFDLKP